MKKITTLFIAFLGVLIGITSCNKPSADSFFQTAVLNVNIIRDFASENLLREIESQTVEFEGHPESKKNGNEAQQVIENKVAYIKQTIERIDAMTPPDEKAVIIKQKSLELFNFVLPVYEKEYMEIAKLADAKKSTKEDLEALAIKIDEKYAAEFEKKHDEIFVLGKAYADENNLNVKFD
ncbi:hypothetical protein [Chishuiella changwenlii]|jgi:hypothetical protein|uniref:hypothetical protein n=1 Tax=Chishuiella changwenlii TaxID=1434701 RepID=UPI002FD9FF63